jgi:glycosyltransferase involved in cell wall biosynthesis
VSAADAAVYVPPNDIDRYAEAIVELLDDEPRRLVMGSVGRDRIERELAWVHQEANYLSVYARLSGGQSSNEDEVVPAIAAPS